MRAWIKSLLIGLLIIQAMAVGTPGTALAAQPATPIVFGSVVADGSIYLTSTAGLHAIDLSTGAERWRLPTPTRASSHPTVAGGIIYFISDAAPAAHSTSVLHAVDTENGQERWSFDVEGILPKDARSLTGPVTVSGHNVYVFESSRVWVLDAASGLVDGSPVASAFLPIGESFVAAHDDRVLLAGTFSHDVGCVSLASGAQLWTAPVMTDALRSPNVSDDTTLYLTREDNAVIALDWATGQERWIAPASTSAAVKFLHLQNEVLIVDRGDHIDGIDPADGSTRWQVAVPNGFADDASFQDETLLVATDEPAIEAVNVENSLVRWTVSLPSRVSSLSRDANGQLIAVLNRAALDSKSTTLPNLMMLDSASGSLIWSLSLTP
jgi:outer membrane protein assembly factor BamB